MGKIGQRNRREKVLIGIGRKSRNIRDKRTKIAFLIFFVTNGGDTINTVGVDKIMTNFHSILFHKLKYQSKIRLKKLSRQSVWDELIIPQKLRLNQALLTFFFLRRGQTVTNRLKLFLGLFELFVYINEFDGGGGLKKRIIDYPGRTFVFVIVLPILILLIVCIGGILIVWVDFKFIALGLTISPRKGDLTIADKMSIKILSLRSVDSHVGATFLAGNINGTRHLGLIV